MTVRFDPIAAKSLSEHPTNLEMTNLRQAQLVCRTSSEWSNAYNITLELSSTLQILLSGDDEPVTDELSMMDNPPLLMGT